jgi:outer membrane protein assembly factor BamA
MNEPDFIDSMLNLTHRFGGDTSGTPKSGFYPELSNMMTGSGWVSIGPGYKQYFANDRALFDTSAAISWRMYKMAQMRLEMPQQPDGHFRLGTQFMWQDDTQVNYFGVGPDISEDARSQYRMQTHDLVGYGMYMPSESLTFSGELGWLGHPKLMDPGGTFVRDFPNTREVFPQDPAASLSEQPAFVHSELGITSDTRDHRGHPTHGGMYRAALTNYWDRSTGFYTFHTWEAEAAQYVPLSDSRVVLAFHGWTVANNPSNEHDVPFYLLPALGGSRTLRDYHDFQFHDNNLLVVNAEVRFAVWTHLDAAVFGDAGNVGHHYGDLNLDKTSWGVGFRLHNERTTLARMDIAHGAQQGFRVVFATTEPFRLPRVRRTTAIIPFTP